MATQKLAVIGNGNVGTALAKGAQTNLLNADWSYAGDDAEAKAQVLALGKAIGFEAVDVGPLLNARYLEALGFLNIQLGYGPTKYGTDLGFKLVK